MENFIKRLKPLRFLFRGSEAGAGGVLLLATIASGVVMVSIHNRFNRVVDQVKIKQIADCQRAGSLSNDATLTAVGNMMASGELAISNDVFHKANPNQKSILKVNGRRVTMELEQPQLALSTDFDAIHSGDKDALGTSIEVTAEVIATRTLGGDVRVSNSPCPNDFPALSMVSEARIENRVNLGLTGGHVDVDTSSQTYEFGKGETDGHQHEYDDEHETDVIDIFTFAGSDKLTTVDKGVPSGKPFEISLANTDLSLGIGIKINDDDYTVLGDKWNDPSNPYLGRQWWLGRATDNDLNIHELKSLEIVFVSSNVLEEKGQVVKSETGCVKANDPGKKGEYRNGAFILQLSPPGTQKNVKHGHVEHGQNLEFLYEVTVFHHTNTDC